MIHPYPNGTRVHHRGGIYSRTFFTELGPVKEGESGGSYWGTVIGRKGPYSDGTYEYEIQADAPLLPGRENRPRWWASYHIDRALKSGSCMQLLDLLRLIGYLRVYRKVPISTDHRDFRATFLP